MTAFRRILTRFKDCLRATEAISTAPKAAMQAFLGLVAPWCVVQTKFIKAACRLTIAGQWPTGNTGTKHAKIRPLVKSTLQPSILRSDMVLPKFCFEKTNRVVIPSQVDWNNCLALFFPEGLVCLTDGFRMDNRSGATTYCQNLQAKWPFSAGTYSAVFQAEVFAIFDCAQENLLRGFFGTNPSLNISTFVWTARHF